MAFSSAMTLRAPAPCDGVIAEHGIGTQQVELPPVGEPFETVEAAFRQLRHQTKNALQRIICEILRHRDLQSTEETSRFFVEMERRICLTARISDSLFGLTAAPGPIEQRLHALAMNMVDLLCEHDQVVECTVSVEGRSPESTSDTIVRIAHEMIGNAIKHGLAGRRVGQIAIRLSARGQRIKLQVLDDGSGAGLGDWNNADLQGEGMPVMRELAKGLGGSITLGRDGVWTKAEFSMPQFPAMRSAKMMRLQQAV